MKSHVSTYHFVSLLQSVYNDVCKKCGAKPQLRDLEVIRSRTEHEGLSFLTITLPDFGRDFESCLESGQVSSTNFRSFRKFGQIPSFLKGIVSLVFDCKGGRLHELDDISIEAIEGVRQLAYTFKKLRVACSEKRTEAAVTEFKQCEAELSSGISLNDTIKFSIVCDLLWNDVLGDINPHELVPKHGPGATAERVHSNRKYLFKRWHSRLEASFPLLANAFPNENAVESKEYERLEMVSEEHEQPVRVVFVPKTLKSPRVIAIEPVCMQFTQQAVAQELIRVLEHHRSTRGHVNFTDQTINRNLALASSIGREYATLDLSSASDRVPRTLALQMFASNVALQRAIDACRSKRATLPTGETLALKKFASMGSAMCFPVESMYFYTLCIGALLEAYHLPATKRNIFIVSRKVFVYGDDLLVPVDYAQFVSDYLLKYLSKVNKSKSFSKGNFRESCGLDAFNGYEVTPTYIRECVPETKRSSTGIISWIASCNHFYKRGYWETAHYLRTVVERLLGMELPVVRENSPALGLLSYQDYHTAQRWNANLCRPEVKAYTKQPVYKTDRLNGYAALLKFFLSNSQEKEKDHLERSPRNRAVTLKLRWTTPY